MKDYTYYDQFSGLNASLHLTSHLWPQCKTLQWAGNERCAPVPVLTLTVYVIMNSICVRDTNLAALPSRVLSLNLYRTDESRIGGIVEFHGQPSWQLKPRSGTPMHCNEKGHKRKAWGAALTVRDGFRMLVMW